MESWPGNRKGAGLYSLSAGNGDGHPCRNLDRAGASRSAAKNDRVRNLLSLAYLVFGAIVASQNSYYSHLTNVSHIVSAVVATALWPLILLGANLHLSLTHL
jgi:hypothetical protein